MTKSVSNHPGFFIVFEGGDGAGKSTQVKKLEQSLKNLNETVVLSREPGGTELGLKIREILLDQNEYEVTPRMEALLFAADRSINMSQVIKPALEKGYVVIADRHIDSSIAYQGIARGLGEQTIEDISRWAVQGVVPDLTINCGNPTALLEGSSTTSGATYAWTGPTAGTPAGSTPTNSTSVAY